MAPSLNDTAVHFIVGWNPTAEGALGHAPHGMVVVRLSGMGDPMSSVCKHVSVSSSETACLLFIHSAGV